MNPLPLKEPLKETSKGPSRELLKEDLTGSLQGTLEVLDFEVTREKKSINFSFIMVPLPKGPKVVPFGGSYLEFYKVIPKRNYVGAYG